MRLNAVGISGLQAGEDVKNSPNPYREGIGRLG
jgi:hypothetical protein